MTALIDGDIVTYRCGFSSENDPKDIALLRCDELIRRIANDLGKKDVRVFIGGQDNFRYQLYPEYKANRSDKPKPKWLEACREFLVMEWNAEIVNGMEADDALGITQSAHIESTVICSIDKDLLQIPGNHYNFVKGIESYVLPLDGLRTFYKQIIAGDGSDNIPSYDGTIRGQVPKFIQRLQAPIDEMEDESEMWEYVKEVFVEDQKDSVVRNARCLWILREEGKHWEEPVKSE